jgi:DNA repair protein RadC
MENTSNNKKKIGGVHNGHRLRVKQRFLKEGLENFDPHQVLELLLFFGIPMKDTNELAHDLLDHFGGVYQVLEASFEDLRQVKGITDHVATMICFAGQLAKRYWIERSDVGIIMDSTQKIGEYLKYRFAGERNEAVYLMSLDNRLKLLNCTRICSGSVNTTEIRTRLVMRQALQDNATKVVVAHNHPNGHAYPSNADLNTTGALIKALAPVEIRLIDHIVVAEDDYVSMADTRSLQHMFK